MHHVSLQSLSKRVNIFIHLVLHCRSHNCYNLISGIRRIKKGDRYKLMIEITERAKQELKRLHNANIDWPGAFLRLMDRGQGNLGLGIDLEATGDKSVEYDGTKVLIVDSKLATEVNEITLDVNDTLDGAELVISGKT